MKTVMWLLVLATFAALVGWLWVASRRAAERRRAAEERAASFLAEAMSASAKSKPGAPAPQERMLLEAATKAAEAGEPALSIQLYARLLSRFPQTLLATQARAAVEAQKKKLGTAISPGPAAPG
jgi:hypothetical protein